MQGSDTKLTALCLAIAIASAPLHAFADPSAAEVAAAHELFDEGLNLETKGDWAAALERFRKVAAVKITPQVRFHLGLCLENTGKLVDALVEFERAKSEAGDAAPVVASSAQKHIVDLKERIPRIVLKVPSAENVALTIDGVKVSSALLGTAIPVDPGKHKIIVTADKQADFTREIELSERSKPTVVEVTFVAASAPQVEAPKVEAPKAAPPPPPPPSKRSPSVLPWVFGGIGLAALGGGAVFYAMRQSTISDLEDACGPDRSRCPSDKQSTYDHGKTYTTVGNVLLGVGVASLATAVVILVAFPSKKGDDKSATAAVTIAGSPGNMGLGFIGRF